MSTARPVGTTPKCRRSCLPLRGSRIEPKPILRTQYCGLSYRCILAASRYRKMSNSTYSMCARTTRVKKLTQCARDIAPSLRDGWLAETSAYAILLGGAPNTTP
jgi:hypothetical protein